jgi:hypothetical protein
LECVRQLQFVFPRNSVTEPIDGVTPTTISETLARWISSAAIKRAGIVGERCDGSSGRWWPADGDSASPIGRLGWQVLSLLALPDAGSRDLFRICRCGRAASLQPHQLLLFEVPGPNVGKIGICDTLPKNMKSG